MLPVVAGYRYHRRVCKTLLIGVLLSMFTMIVITRVILKTFANHQPKSLAAYGVKMGGAD